MYTYKEVDEDRSRSTNVMRPHKSRTFTRSLTREEREESESDDRVHCSFSFSFSRSNCKFLFSPPSRHHYHWHAAARIVFTRCGFTTIAEPRSHTRIASILLSPQFPHSRQVFSFALVHVERAPSVDRSSVISGIAA